MGDAVKGLWSLQDDVRKESCVLDGGGRKDEDAELKR